MQASDDFPVWFHKGGMRHGSDAVGFAMAYGCTRRAAEEFKRGCDAYPILEAAYVLGPLRCYKSPHKGWMLDGAPATRDCIKWAASLVPDDKRPAARGYKKWLDALS